MFTKSLCDIFQFGYTNCRQAFITCQVSPHNEAEYNKGMLVCINPNNYIFTLIIIHFEVGNIVTNPILPPSDDWPTYAFAHQTSV